MTVQALQELQARQALSHRAQLAGLQLAGHWVARSVATGAWARHAAAACRAWCVDTMVCTLDRKRTGACTARAGRWSGRVEGRSGGAEWRRGVGEQRRTAAHSGFAISRRERLMLLQGAATRRRVWRWSVRAEERGGRAAAHRGWTPSRAQESRSRKLSRSRVVIAYASSTGRMLSFYGLEERAPEEPAVKRRRT